MTSDANRHGPTIRRRRGVPWARTLWLAVLILCLLPVRPAAQDWFRTGTGLGVKKIRLALPDFSGPGPNSSLGALFNQVLWNDLEYSGILEMVSKSFYPLPASWPTAPSQLQPTAWTAAPVAAQMILYGSLTQQQNGLEVHAWMNDLGNPGAAPVLAKIYRGAADPQAVRRLAHELADDVVQLLSGGVPGIAQTRIAFTSTRSGRPELWVMDYDGANQQQLTHLGTAALTPRWSPDGTLIAFTCFEPYRGVLSAQICIYSLLAHRLLHFPRFAGTTSSPAWSPDGRQLAFMGTALGGTQIFVSDASGGHRRQLTFVPRAVNTSPMWNPRTGQQMVFVSDRGGSPQLYLMNADGSNVVKIDLPDMGYVIDPAWSPNGQLLAFSWRRPGGNYDLYVMDLATRQLLELTRDAGRNERPSWAPDGRHLVFESTRSGSRQIWTMLADGSGLRQLTTGGENFSPNWSWH